MKSHKAPGEDLIEAKMIKYGGEELMRRVLVQRAWTSKEMPEEWNTTIYRGVSLLNVAYKVWSKVLTRRLKVYSERAIGDYQCGFHRGRSTTDHIFTIHCIIENCYEYNIPSI